MYLTLSKCQEQTVFFILTFPAILTPSIRYSALPLKARPSIWGPPWQKWHSFVSEHSPSVGDTGDMPRREPVSFRVSS